MKRIEDSKSEVQKMIKKLMIKQKKILLNQMKFFINKWKSERKNTEEKIKQLKESSY